MKNSLIVLFVISSSFGFAQKQGNIWYFGDHAGLDFNNNPPIPLLNGQTHFAGLNHNIPESWDEGCSSISDSSGSLLFYTNGFQIWNKIQQVMPNGDSLMGNISSTQSSIIVPQPNSQRYFYVFTTDAQEGNFKNGLRYSVVDMCLDGGNGDIISSAKNILLVDTATEKLICIRHSNGIDYWIVVHTINTDAFYSLKLTNTGIVDTVISHTGTIDSNGVGQMKASPNGQMIGYATPSAANGFTLLLNFNSATGVVSNEQKLQSSAISTEYAVSFSPDNSKLYFSTVGHGEIYQYDLNAGNLAAIIASKLHIIQNGPDSWRQIQLGTDGKLYLSRADKSYLSEIQYPDSLFPACNYIDSAIYLGGKYTSWGLPNFISNYSYSNTECNCPITVSAASINLQCNKQCTGTATVSPSGGTSPFTYSWSNGQTSQTAVGLCAGSYIITITDALSATITDTITITQPSALTFTSSFTNTCSGSTTGSASVNVTGGTPGYSYSWSNGQNVQNATGLSGGTYIISVTDMNGCVDTTSVNISTLSSPTVVLTASNTTICSGQSTTLSASGGIIYNWNTGDTTSSITVFPTAPTTYSVTVTGVNGCTTTASQAVIVNPAPTAAISGANAICSGDSSILIASGGTSYHWSTGDTLSSIVVKPTNDSTYKVVVTNKGCKDSTTKTVNVNSYPLASISGTTVICANQSTMLTASGGDTYVWSTGDTSQTISVMPNTNIIYLVAVTKNGCTSNASQSVTVNPVPIINITGGGVITEGQSIQLAVSNIGTFSWTPATGLSCTTCSNPYASPEINTTYCVMVTDSNNCASNACVSIDVNCGAIFVPSAFSPNGDGENDILFARGKCIQTFDFMVFNRWGEKVFETTNLANGWDGTFNGQTCTSDAFTYYLNATLLDGSSVSKKGFVMLVR